MNKQIPAAGIPATARSAFAGLEGNWAYFDNAGGSFTLNSVIERVGDYMRSTPVQLGGSYDLSRLAATRQADAVTQLARFMNAASPAEIVLGSSSTALAWQLARALRPQLESGDEIIVTVMDHEANRSPWLWLREFGVKIRTWEIDQKDFGLSLAQLDALLNERTRLVCFSHCSNVLGRIEPAVEITRRAHAAGARVVVDGVAYAPHRRVDLQDLDVDFYVCSLYKIFGPHLGLLYGKKDELLALGNINHEYLPADALPHKLQPGGASYELAWGATGIVEYFDTWKTRCDDPFAAIAAHEANLATPLLEYLDAHPAITLLGPATGDPSVRVGIIAFRHATRTSAEIAAALNAQRLAVKNGHFHARRLMEFLGIPPDDGVVRISFAHYNTVEEGDRLLRALDEVLR